MTESTTPADEKTTTPATEDKTKPAATTTPDPKDAGGDDDDSHLSAEDLKKRNKALGSEIASKREALRTEKERAKAIETELAAYKKKEQDAETAKLKEQGEHKQVAEKLEQQLNAKNDRIKRAELKLLGQAAGILDPSDLESISLEGITLNDKDEVLGADKIIEKLKADKKHWFKSETDPATKPDDKPKPTTSGTPEIPPGGKGDAKPVTELKTVAQIEDYNKSFLKKYKK